MRELDQARRRLYELDALFQQSHPQLAPNMPAYARAFARAHGDFAKKYGLGVSLTSLRKLRKAVRENPAGVLDGRSNSGRKAKAYDPRLFDEVRAIALKPGHTLEDAIECQQIRARVLGVEPIPEWRVKAFWLHEITYGEKVLGREGPRAFEMKATPKLHRDWSTIPAGAFWSIDGHTFDVLVRVPIAGGGVRLMRPTASGVLCPRSKGLVVVVGRSENTGLILRTFEKAYRVFGTLPDDVQGDNGKAYKRAGRGTRERGHDKKLRRRLVKLLDGRAGFLAGIFERVGVRLRHVRVKSPWLKAIESHWRWLVRYVSRWFASYIGGSPSMRPHDVYERLKLAPELAPTLAEFTKIVDDGVELLWSKPRRNLNGLTPREALERFRGTPRIVPESALNAIFSVADERRLVGRDGIQYRGTLYRPAPEDLAVLQGKRVWVMPDLEHAGRIGLVNDAGRLCCYAEEAALMRADATPEQLAEGIAYKARYRRSHRKAAELRPLGTQPAAAIAIRQQLDELALQKSERDRRRVAAGITPPPVPTDPPVIVGAQLAQNVAEVEQKTARQKARAGKQIQALMSFSSGSRMKGKDAPVRDPFALLPKRSILDGDGGTTPEPLCPADAARSFGNAG